MGGVEEPVFLLLVLACYRPTGPAPTGSASAVLAGQAAEVGRKAALLAEHSKSIEGWIDEWRAAPVEQQSEIEQKIQVRAVELKAEAEALQAEVHDIEAQAEVW